MIESLLADREVLYLVRLDGCAACAASEIELVKFETRYPTLTVIRVDANGPYPARLGLKIKATPVWFFRRGEEGVQKIGFLKEKDLERWLKSLEAKL